MQLVLVLSGILLIQACGDDNPTRITFTPPDPFNTSNADSSWTSEDGLTVYVIEQGYGWEEVIARDQIEILYTGRTKDGDIFESTYRNDLANPRFIQNLTPVPIRSGNQSISPLIDGFRRGLLGMVEGEKRTIVVPPSLGYGESQEGTNGFNLRNDTLILGEGLGGMID
jgi:FKBP-type peptidyl-prolyl cis-trans isomerase